MERHQVLVVPCNERAVNCIALQRSFRAEDESERFKRGRCTPYGVLHCGHSAARLRHLQKEERGRGNETHQPSVIPKGVLPPA